ncbi:MAG: putative hydrolase of the superfamily [Thermoleophilaceae bacterium]|nr:putative hydrolase of the superfamily [Thermoleophilaceae bacterium]
MSPPTTVVCDFGGVLTNPLIEAFTAYQEQSGISFEELGSAMMRLAEKADGEHPLFELEKGRISEAEFQSKLAAELGRDEPLGSLSESYFAHLRPNEPMIDYVRTLRDRGLRMALLTNNVRELEPHWRAQLPDIDEIFELVVDSAFVGMRKPEPEIYELTLERLGGVPAEECVFIDDTEVNCQMAERLGMRAVHFRDNEQAIAAVESIIRPGD